MIVHSGARFDLVALFDQGINDKGLLSAFDLRADQRVSAFAFLRPQHMRCNRLASGRHLIHDAQVEIAIQRQRQRARDGRGGHHQQVRRAAFRAQQRALIYAETVLFIHHGQLQI